jgi:hypothetical protein
MAIMGQLAIGAVVGELLGKEGWTSAVDRLQSNAFQVA